MRKLICDNKYKGKIVGQNVTMIRNPWGSNTASDKLRMPLGTCKWELRDRLCMREAARARKGVFLRDVGQALVLQ